MRSFCICVLGFKGGFSITSVFGSAQIHTTSEYTMEIQNIIFPSIFLKTVAHLGHTVTISLTGEIISSKWKNLPTFFFNHIFRG